MPVRNEEEPPAFRRDRLSPVACRGSLCEPGGCVELSSSHQLGTRWSVVTVLVAGRCLLASVRPRVTQSEANASTAKAVAESDINILRQGSPFWPPCSRSKLSEWERHASQ